MRPSVKSSTRAPRTSKAPPSTHSGTVASLDEAFLTSVSRGVLPVTRIDELSVGPGRPGPVTRDLMRGFRALAEQEAESVFD